MALAAARASGLAMDEAVPLESVAAGMGAIKAFSTWQSVVATVNADVDRVLANAREAVAAYSGAAAELSLNSVSWGSGAQGSGAAPTAAAVAVAVADGGVAVTVDGAASGTRTEELPLRAQHAAARAGATAATQRVAELEKFSVSLADLVTVSRDVATAALLDSAEDFAGEIKGGAREVRVADETHIAPSMALISPAALQVRASPFVRERVAGEMIIWSSLTGQKATRTRVVAGNSIEVELPKIVLTASALNSAARVSTTLCTAHQPPTAARARPSAAPARAPARPKSGNKNKTEEATPAPDAPEKDDSEKKSLDDSEKKSLVGEGKEGGEGGSPRSPRPSTAGSSRPVTADSGKLAEGEKKGGESTEPEAEVAVAVAVTETEVVAPPLVLQAAPVPPTIPLRALGGWVHVEMFATTAPPKSYRGWAISSVAEAGGLGVRALAASLARIEHPAERNASAAAVTAVRVKWTLPAHLLTDAPAVPCAGGPRAPAPARWLEERQIWSTVGVPEPSWSPATRALQFLTLSFSPHALVQPLAADWPYVAWALTPAPLASNLPPGAPASPAVLLKIETARGFKVAIHITAAGCALVSPRLPSLAWLLVGNESEEATATLAAAATNSITTHELQTNPLPGAPRLPPGELLDLLDSAGLRLTPCDADVVGVNALLAAEAAIPLPPLPPAVKGASRTEREAAVTAHEEAAAARAAAPAPMLPPLLSSSIEATLTADLSRAAAAFTISCVPGRGYKTRVAPADPDDCPPNAGAPVLAEILFLETLTPARADGVGEHTRAWAQDPTATLRMRVTEDPGCARGFKVQTSPEGVSRALGDPFTLAPPFASIDESILQRASPEARVVALGVPASFTEVLRRTLLLMRPLAFSA